VSNSASTIPNTIEAAAKSPLGILALLILICAIVSLSFFKKASEKTKVVIFSFFAVGTIMFTSALFVQMPNALVAAPAATPPTTGPLPAPGLAGNNASGFGPAVLEPLGGPPNDIRGGATAKMASSDVVRDTESAVAGRAVPLSVDDGTQTDRTSCRSLRREISDPALPFVIRNIAAGCVGVLNVTATYSGEALFKDVGPNSSQTSEVRIEITDQNSGTRYCLDRSGTVDRSFNSFSIRCLAAVPIDVENPANIMVSVYKANVGNVNPLSVIVSYRPSN
jgi:hypothetical protein